MINNEQNIGVEEESFSTKIVTETPKKSFRDYCVGLDNSVWKNGRDINFFGIEGMKVLPSEEWTIGDSDFFTINFLKNVGSTITGLIKGEDKEMKSYIEDEPKYVVEFSEAPSIETEEINNFNDQFDAAPEKFDPFIK